MITATPRPPLRHHRYTPRAKLLAVGEIGHCPCGARAKRTTARTVKVLVGDAWLLQFEAPSSRCER